jgi:V/A-type H+-transporting ATPase subunit F
MKFFCVSDNIDTKMGMRLAGIEGVVVHEQDEVEQAIRKACYDPEIGIILVSEKLVKLCPKLIYEIKLHTKIPLIVEIPDRHGTANISDNITNYVREAIGIKI